LYWIDGTLLPASSLFWDINQPDNSGGNEDCGSIWNPSTNSSGLNDIPCHSTTRPVFCGFAGTYWIGLVPTEVIVSVLEICLHVNSVQLYSLLQLTAIRFAAFVLQGHMNMWSNVTGQSICTLCPILLTTGKVGSTSQQDCVCGAGYLAVEVNGSVICSECPAGKFSDLNSTVHTPVLARKG
jgi:hypothetical protein